jgi:hypothetical protein
MENWIMTEVSPEYSNFHKVTEGTYLSTERILSIHTVSIGTRHDNPTKYFIEIYTKSTEVQENLNRVFVTAPAADYESVLFQLNVFLSNLDRITTKIKKEQHERTQQ